MSLTYVIANAMTQKGVIGKFTLERGETLIRK
jgi:hypothetical protein